MVQDATCVARSLEQQTHLECIPHNYLAYGVPIRSDFPDPFSGQTVYSKPTIIITRGTAPLVPALPKRRTDAWFYHDILPNGSTYLCWPELFEFLVSANGREVVGRELTDVSKEVFSTYLLGQVLSFSLVKMGLDALHASAVVVNGRCVGLLGDSGLGKSTLLAIFLQNGHKQLTDDLLLIRPKRDLLMAYPGPPRIKLLPDSAALINGPEMGVEMNPRVAKKVIPICGNQFQKSPVPLQALYILEQTPISSRTKISKEARGKGLLELIRHSFNLAVRDSERLELQFRWAARIASTVPIKRVAYPRSFDKLSEVQAAILADLA